MTIAMTEDQAVILRQRIGQLDSAASNAPSEMQDVLNREAAAVAERDLLISVLTDAGFPVDPDDA
jgi:hypothetical protein